MIGQSLTHYKITNLLGKGGMGEVYMATDTRLGRSVAIKVLPKQLSDDPHGRARFEREARTISNLNHPHICTLHDVGEDGGVHFLVMEYIEGDTLAERIKHGPLPLEDVVRYGNEIARALHEAHQAGVVHRDLKPGNIMITKEGVKLLDFGLAKPVSSARPVTPEDETTIDAVTEHGSLLGTVEYMAPEQLEGKEADARTDIFALGVVLYEMVTGQRAFSGASQASIISAIMTQDPPRVSELQPAAPAKLDNLIEQCLAKAPEARWTSVNDLATQLLSCSELVSTVDNRRDSRIARAGSRSKRWLQRFVWAVVPIAVLSVATIVIVRNLTPDRPGQGKDTEQTDARAEQDRSTTGVDAVDSAEDRIRLVVLPFKNIGDPEQEFFADGMTDEMITLLGGASPDRLGVIARTSTMQFKGRDTSLEAIRSELNVDYVLEGSVRRHENQVRITARLVDVKDQTQAWSSNFNGTMDDVLSLQSSVARKIADALAIALTPESRVASHVRVVAPGAYDEYLNGRYWDHKGTEQGWRQAIDHYEKAVAIDPAFASAHAALAQSLASLASWNTLPPGPLLKKARVAAQEALRLDEHLADAHSASALVDLMEWNWSEAEAGYERALTLNPTDGLSYHWLGHYLSAAGRDREALDAFAGALRLDPLSAFHRGCLGLTQVASGDIGLAEQSIGRSLERSPEMSVTHKWLGLLRERQQQMESAVAAWEDAVHHSSRRQSNVSVLGYGYAQLVQSEEARAILDELELRSRETYVAEFDRARVYAGLGELDNAFAYLESSFSNREPWMPFAITIEPGFDTLRPDPRYEALLRRIAIRP